MSSWFISDLHLKDVHERNSQLLLRFLFYLNQNPKAHRLFLLGDIFDLWISSGPAYTNHFAAIINEIAKFKKNGGIVYYFEGNHDFHIDVFWTKKLDIPVIEDELFLDIEGLVVRMEHGDFINPDDHKYLEYRKNMRKPWMEAIIHLAPSFLVKAIGDNQSGKSRKRSHRYAKDNIENLRGLIRTYAQKKYHEKPFDLIVTGHMHVFDMYTFADEAKQVTSINLGTWLEKPRILKIENKKIEVIELEKFLFDQL